MNEIKRRNKLAPELIRLIKHQIECGRHNKEISTLNNISLTTAKKYANLISVGTLDTDLFKKRGGRKSDDSET